MNKLIVVLGPTATGKSGLAVKLAKKFNGEIISADSRQVYKSMDIGTGKIMKEEMESVPHYLLDIVYPDKKFSVAIYKKLAIKTIKDIQKKGKIPFLVGGTGLYISAIINNFEFPAIAPDENLRNKLEKKSTEELFKIYKRLDYEGSKLIDKKNKRRLVRAIEVSKKTNRPYWDQRKKEKPLFNSLEIGIKISKEELKKKIKKRIENMFRMGLKEEVKKLFDKYGFNHSPLQTIGYQEWIPYFKKEINEEDVKRLIQVHTIQFMNRQITWFRKDKRIHWIEKQKEAEDLIKKFL